MSTRVADADGRVVEPPASATTRGWQPDRRLAAAQDRRCVQGRSARMASWLQRLNVACISTFCIDGVEVGGVRSPPCARTGWCHDAQRAGVQGVEREAVVVRAIASRRAGAE